jgi:hypothetical protein
MFSLFKRRTPPPPAELTFKARVAEFWKWYAGAAERLYQTIEDKRCGDLTAEISGRVNEVVPGLAWVFGPGHDGKGHSLTLSGEGNPHRQWLAEYWRAQAPQLPGWTFYSSRQPSPDPGSGIIRLAELDFDPKAFWLTPSINEARELIDLVVWHPLFPQLDDKTRWTILFLFLDEALGEIGTQNWIGEITMNDSRLADAVPLAELRAFTEGVQAKYDWQKGGPRELWTSYQCEEDRLDEPRGDVFVGTSNMMALVDEHGRAGGKLEDPLAGAGADYIYVQFDARFLPRGHEVDNRGAIEDALIAALNPTASGWHLGGAMGRRFAYIDLLIFDGAASIALVRETLRRLRLPQGTSINYFAYEKRGHRLLI